MNKTIEKLVTIKAGNNKGQFGSPQGVTILLRTSSYSRIISNPII